MIRGFSVMQNEKIGRNDACTCGSGKKYKKCCLLSVLSHSDTIDPEWRALRQMEGELVHHDLLGYVQKAFPREIFNEAWNDLLLGEEIPESLNKALAEGFFSYWFMFDWESANDYTEDNANLPKQPIALHYLQRHRQRLTSKKIQFIETACQSHFSYYVVLDVVPKKSITLKDILLGSEYTVKEYQASTSVKKGDIMFTRILTMDEISLCIGTSPCIIPSSYHIDLLNFRKELETEHKNQLTAPLLRSLADDLRKLNFQIITALYNPVMPVLHNTDGNIFQPCTISFKLNLGIEEALNKLLPLTLSDDPNEFLSAANKTKDGQLKEIKLHWLKGGNSKHHQWDNTLMGNITIQANKLKVEVNSKERADIIIQLLNECLGAGVSDRKIRVESVKKMHSTARAKETDNSNIPDITDSPEAQAFLKEMCNKHWNNWLNELIPALDGLTPMQATKSKDGRDKLEALLLDYENRDARTPNNLLRPNISELREKLGLDL
jgi:hypothetical protein